MVKKASMYLNIMIGISISVAIISGALALWFYFPTGSAESNMDQAQNEINSLDSSISDSKNKIERINDMMKYGIKTMKSTDGEADGFMYFNIVSADYHSEEWEVPLELILKDQEKALKQSEKEKESILKATDFKKLKKRAKADKEKVNLAGWFVVMTFASIVIFSALLSLRDKKIFSE